MQAKRLPKFADDASKKQNLDRRPGFGQRLERPSRLAALNAAEQPEVSTSRFSGTVVIIGLIALAGCYLADRQFLGGTYTRMAMEVVRQACAEVGFYI